MLSYCWAVSETSHKFLRASVATGADEGESKPASVATGTGEGESETAADVTGTGKGELEPATDATGAGEGEKVNQRTMTMRQMPLDAREGESEDYDDVDDEEEYDDDEEDYPSFLENSCDNDVFGLFNDHRGLYLKIAGRSNSYYTGTYS